MVVALQSQPSALLPVVAEVLPRVARIALFIAFGVFLANLAVGFGLVERVAGLSRFLTGPANLPDEVGTAILTTAASTTAGYGMLAEFRESGTLDDKATLVAVTINTFFGFVQHIFTFYLPVLLPILGLRVGLLYVGSRALVALCITFTGVFAGALLLSPANVDQSTTTAADGGAQERGSDTPREVVHNAWDRTLPKLRRIVPRLAVVYTLVVVLTRTTDLTALTEVADPLATIVGLPGAAIPVIAVFALDTTAGAATIAPLVGVDFTARQAVATMLIGGIVSFAVSTFKRSIPFQYGIWGPRFGSKVVAVNTALKIVWIGAAVATLLWIPSPL
ncbi:nucleoside recognition protein [Halogeometricum sp. S1BR25-6]|uniref:Nucleoside recognition protein n=1 Tax=Halogeometricum salsisoli TaxID=2950536 RepID=A0ABU2GAS9_9EURY|nr:nucleoside recognition protein [Halogeometricum sp. S1BR25-6]MDS0297373.1 nucleoside recognition protein [Halogeometricum sp. S1BR25-6]